MSRHGRPRPARRPRGSLRIGTLALLLAVAAGTGATAAGQPDAAPGVAAQVADSERAAVASQPQEPSPAASRAERAAPAAVAALGQAKKPGKKPAKRPAATNPAAEPATEPATAPAAAPAPPPVRHTAPPIPAPAPARGGGQASGAFGLLPPGSDLPSSAECAARVQRDPWEPRPGNARANTTRPAGGAAYGMGTWYTPEADGADYRGRVSGDFTGTTDEIIQWASCKWGFPTDLSRAQAVAETTWDQYFVGDAGESFGLFQMRRGVWGGHPNSRASTAFNADWALGLRRACYDGAMWYPQLRGNLEACIGVHYSGDPDPSTWRAYVDTVLRHERSRPWLSWRSATGTPPTDRG